MKAVYSPYLLKKKNKLNSLDKTEFQKGTLIKIYEGENWGVADICPKPELGDQPLENEIKNKGFLYTRAFELALEDFEARRDERSLLTDKFVRNNFLITANEFIDLKNPDYLNQTVKIKADQDFKYLSNNLNLCTVNVKLRIDFNSVLQIDEFETFINLLSTEAKNKIEYIEDPTIFNPEWKRWNKIVPLAFDFQTVGYNPEYADHLIVKPSRQRIPVDLQNFTLTSAMEHPVGLAHGLRVAQKMAKNVSGFLTLDLFETNDFQKFFVQKNNNLNFSESALNDYGIGMGDELAKLNWIEL